MARASPSTVEACGALFSTCDEHRYGKGKSLHPSEHATAWDHPPTRWAWVGHMAVNFIGLIGWLAMLLGLFYVLLGYLSPGFSALFAPLIVYSFYRVVIQLRYFPASLDVLQVLQFYPWQVLHGAPRSLDQHPGAEADGMWIEFPYPEGNGEKGIPLVFVKHYRSLWWLKRIGGPRTKPELKAQLDTLWFAGDPRFLGVVAVPSKNGDSPRRLHFLYQPSACAPAAARRHWGNATFADLERARRAGARFVEPTPSPR